MSGGSEIWQRDWRTGVGGSSAGGGGAGAGGRGQTRGGTSIGQESTHNNSRATGSSRQNFRRGGSWRQPRPDAAGQGFPSGPTSGTQRSFRSASGSGSGFSLRGQNNPRSFPSRGFPAGQSSPSGQGQGNGAKDDPETTAAIAEGRRIYVGNLLYSAKPEDIEGLLANCGLAYDRIHISIDPFTGRNPSYCFVEFATKPLADAAMAMLSGQELLGREIKVGPCVPKTKADRGETFKRWGDWKGAAAAAAENNPPGSRDVEIVEDGGARLASPQSSPAGTSTGGPYEALKHWEGMADAKRRLYVGGLPRMTDQRTCDHQVRELFADFNVEAVSKAISPHNKDNKQQGGGTKGGHANSYYCFVDFPTAEEAARAAEKTNGKRMWGGRLRVAHAKGDSRKWREREQFEGWDGSKAIKIAQGIGIDET